MIVLLRIPFKAFTKSKQSEGTCIITADMAVLAQKATLAGVALPWRRSGRIGIPKHTPLFGISSTAKCRFRMSRRGLAQAAHIGHNVLPIASLLRRHGMSATPPTPEKSSSKLTPGRHCGRRGTAPSGSNTRRNRQAWRLRGSASDRAHSKQTMPYWGLPV